jgi:hypothetical protein
MPITTTAMLRSIAAIANEFGEDLSQPEIHLQCLSVFAFGGPTHADDAMDSSYLSFRIGMQYELAAATKVVAQASAAELAEMLQKGTAPAVVRFIARIAAAFDVAVTQKMCAQSLPAVGAVTGAAINAAFLDHFNRVARFHFGLRSLERKYGAEPVQAKYRLAVREVQKLTGQSKSLPSVEQAPKPG